MLVVIVLAIFALVVVFDTIPLKKSWSPVERAVYCACLLVSFCALMLFTIGVTLPSPSKGIEAVVRMLFPGIE